MSLTTSYESHVALRLEVLDGWRGISILLVLAAHLLPLGPKSWELNETAARLGMAVFFTLSGFLIAKFLLEKDSILDFLFRRLFRIVPLVWVTVLVSFAIAGVDTSLYFPNLFFYANLPPPRLTSFAGHYWSLGVEVQFYVCIALLVACGGRRSLLIIPIVCLAITFNRVLDGAHADIVTWRRVDEILVGSTLALVYCGKLGSGRIFLLQKKWTYVWIVLAAISSSPASGFMNYMRPYFTVLAVGSTLYGSRSEMLGKVLTTKWLAYVATISFALYIFHLLLASTWLGEGNTWVRYAKRPLLFAAIFAVAHLSTFYFEQPMMTLGRKAYIMTLGWGEGLSLAIRKIRDAIGI